MKEKVYQYVELTGTSNRSIEEAVDTALKQAAKAGRNLRWFEVIETRGDITKNKVNHWQVTIKVGYTLE